MNNNNNNNSNNKQKKKTKKKRKDMKKMIKDDNDNGVVILAVDNYNTLITRPTTTGSNSKGNNNKILVRLFVLFLMVGISTIVYDSKYISNYSQIMIKMKSNDLIYNDDNEEDDGVVNNTVREHGQQQSQMSRDNNQQQQQQQHNQQQQQQPPSQQNQSDMLSFEEVMRERKQKDEEDTEDTDDVDDDNDDGVDRRPYLILHVGPPKTGTTTIQSGLFKILKELAIHDNYYYLGEKLGGKVHTIQFNHNNNNNTSGQNNSVTTTTKVFPMKDFVYEGQPSQEFCHHIKYHLQQNHNVILSAELFTEHFSRNKWKQLYTNLFLMSSNNDNQSNNQNTTHSNSNSNNLEVLFGFNVKIITTYRHLFQWVPSYYHQKHLENLWQDKKTIGIVDYIQDYLINNQNYFNLENNNNTTTTKTKIVHLNKNVKSWYGSRKEIGSGNPNLIHGSIWSYLFWSEQIKSIASLSDSNSDSNSNIVPKNGNGNGNDDDRAYDVSGGELYNRVHVFDMHQQKLNLNLNWNLNLNKNMKNMTQPTTTTTNYNMFTNFICQMIPNANHTCQLLQQQDAEEEQQRQHDHDQGGQRERSGGHGHHHERSSHTINEYLSLQDRYRIYQMARYGHMTDTDTDTDTNDTTITDNNSNNNSNRLLIEKFNFKYNKNENKMSKQITDRMKNWFHLQEDEQNNISTTSTNISTDTVFFQRMNDFRCLTDTNLQQLKQLSWNFLVQQILLVRIHHFSNSLANSNSKFINPNPNPISSDNRAYRNTNLILSSQFDFNTMNNNRNNDNVELLLKCLTPLKLKHDTLFHDYYANTNKFCQINPEKILTNHDFVQYVFRNKYYK